jgi:hypothetical protein
MTDNNTLTDPMPKAEIDSLDLLKPGSCTLGKLLGEMFVV